MRAITRILQHFENRETYYTRQCPVSPAGSSAIPYGDDVDGESKSPPADSQCKSPGALPVNAIMEVNIHVD